MQAYATLLLIRAAPILLGLALATGPGVVAGGSEMGQGHC